MIKNIIKSDMYEIVLRENFLHIKNYINVLEIYPNKIIILLKNKKLIINGNDLIISALDEYEILIKGNIKGIDFNE